jgi:hypothetical protein
VKTAHGELLQTLETTDAKKRYKAFTALIALTNRPVPWAYEAWDSLLRLTKDGDNHQRTIGVQLLANLAKSDTEGRMLKALSRLVAVTKDPMFVTARHSLLCLWKIGVKDEQHRKAVIRKLVTRFKECVTERNRTLIRYDIQTVLRKIHDGSGDSAVRVQALKLIGLETDEKYRKKYATAWRNTGPAARSAR